MKGKISLLVVVLAVTGLMLGCAPKEQSKEHEHGAGTEMKMEEPAQEIETKMEKPAQEIQYTCPMHPEVISDKPGNCPKCGMNLEEKK